MPTSARLSGAVKFCHALSDRDRRLLHESRVIERVMAGKAPRGIVPLTDAHLGGEVPWLMYEYVDGGTLADVARSWQRRPAADRVVLVVRALVMLGRAVGWFHRLTPPIVHRDLKPANILFDREGKRLRITDFGIGATASDWVLRDETVAAGTLGFRLSSTLRGSHTPLYASPQQKVGASPDPRDDVHALGVIGYQLMTGDLTRGPGPDAGEDLREACMGDDLIELLLACTAGRADRRPADAHELAERFAAFLDVPDAPSTPVGASSTPVPHTMTPPLRKAKGTNPGIIATIAEILSAATADAPLSKRDLHARLTERFPDRPPDGMWATVNAQVPHRLRSEKGLAVHQHGDRYWIEGSATPNEGPTSGAPPLPFPDIPMSAFRAAVQDRRTFAGHPTDGRDIVYVYRATARGGTSYHPLFGLPPDGVKALLAGELPPEQSILCLHREQKSGNPGYDPLHPSAFTLVDPSTGTAPISVPRMQQSEAQVLKDRLRRSSLA